MDNDTTHYREVGISQSQNPNEGHALLCSARTMWDAKPGQTTEFNRWSSKRALGIAATSNPSDKAIAERFIARFYALYS